MTDETPYPQEARDPIQRSIDRVDSAKWGGWLLALVGVVDGVVMILSRKLTTCSNGTTFPLNAKDTNCYAHPRADLGVAVIALSLGLAVVVWLTSISARASLEAQR